MICAGIDAGSRSIKVALFETDAQVICGYGVADQGVQQDALAAELFDRILGEAGLSFLGLGVQEPYPSWGGMLAEARENYRYAWWLGVFPGLAIVFTVLAFNLLGDGLRDAFDPRTKE